MSTETSTTAKRGRKKDQKYVDEYYALVDRFSRDNAGVGIVGKGRPEREKIAQLLELYGIDFKSDASSEFLHNLLKTYRQKALLEQMILRNPEGTHVPTKREMHELSQRGQAIRKGRERKAHETKAKALYESIFVNMKATPTKPEVSKPRHKSAKPKPLQETPENVRQENAKRVAAGLAMVSKPSRKTQHK